MLHANELEESSYFLIWRYLARERAGESGAAEFAASAARSKSADWPDPIVELYLGQRSPADVLSAASKADERCEAQFYIGEWHLLHGDRTAAAAALQTAADSCPKEFDEYTGALAELKRLTRSNATKSCYLTRRLDKPHRRFGGSCSPPVRSAFHVLMHFGRPYLVSRADKFEASDLQIRCYGIGWLVADHSHRHAVTPSLTHARGNSRLQSALAGSNRHAERLRLLECARDDTKS